MKFALDEIRSVAKWLLDEVDSYRIWCFVGEMGAGKTTLIKEICEELGVQDRMSSPTFSIVNEYLAADDQSIYHFDFYRIEKQKEAFDIGVEEYFESGFYCFIEWPDRIIDLLPDRYVEIRINLVDDNQRIINLIRHDGEH